MTCCALRRSKSNASGDAALGRSSHHSRRQLRDRADHEDPGSACTEADFRDVLWWLVVLGLCPTPFRFRQRGLRRPYRIIYSIFQRFNLEWKTRTLSVFNASRLDVTLIV